MGLLTLIRALAFTAGVCRAEPRVRPCLNWVNGTLFLGGHDFDAQAGRWTVLTRAADIAVDGGAGLTVRVEARVGRPALALIRLSSR